MSKRREEQREATEKFQRSHIPTRPPSGRTPSSRKSMCYLLGKCTKRNFAEKENWLETNIYMSNQVKK